MFSQAVREQKKIKNVKQRQMQDEMRLSKHRKIANMGGLVHSPLKPVQAALLPGNSTYRPRRKLPTTRLESNVTSKTTMNKHISEFKKIEGTASLDLAIRIGGQPGRFSGHSKEREAEGRSERHSGTESLFLSVQNERRASFFISVQKRQHTVNPSTSSGKEYWCPQLRTCRKANLQSRDLCM
ncbi:hypothetical protein PABG_12001 [Paracoccidioides brasiliensis Pb03]|nr:hypothetical protein PABG_12001 [Paracoccidioides brasiliensis Pb03]